MKLLENIKKKIKAIAAQIAGKAPEPSFANIFIIKNGINIYDIESTSPNISEGICKIIQFFNKYDNYKIIYNYPEKEIYIYFTVKKADELEPTESEEKKK